MSRVFKGAKDLALKKKRWGVIGFKSPSRRLNPKASDHVSL